MLCKNSLAPFWGCSWHLRQNCEQELIGFIPGDNSSLLDAPNARSMPLHGDSRPKAQVTFRDLPAELRTMIWKAAHAPRLLLLKPGQRNTTSESQSKVDFTIIPGMLYANRESRRIALLHYDQRFTLDFTKFVGVRGTRFSTRIPIIMSSIDKIAFSISQVDADFRLRNVIWVSLDAAPGEPEPWVESFALLNDSIMRPGIDTEHLARILDPEFSGLNLTSSADINVEQFIDWSPFSRRPEPGILDDNPEGVETFRVRFEACRDGHVEVLSDWFNNSSICATYLNDTPYRADAWVIVLPQPFNPPSP